MQPLPVLTPRHTQTVDPKDIRSWEGVEHSNCLVVSLFMLTLLWSLIS